MNNYDFKGLFLIVVVDSKTGGLATQVVNQKFIETMGLFNWYMKKFFVSEAEKMKAAAGGAEPEILPDILRFLGLVEHGLHDEAYGVFLQGAKKTDLRICGIYRYSNGQFKKMAIKVLKGVADAK